MKLFRSKKGLAIGVAAAMTVGIAGGAFAYFSTSGDGSSTATVGSSKAFDVSVGAATGDAVLLPGDGTVQHFAYTVTNPASFDQALTSTTATLKNDGTDVWDTAAATPGIAVGCHLSWFAVTDNGPAAATLHASDFATGSVDVSLNESNTLQDACKGVKPEVDVHAA